MSPKNDTNASEFFDFFGIAENAPELLERLRSEVGKLGKTEQAIVSMRLQGYTYMEIARELRVSEGRISGTMKKLRRRLR